VDLEEFCGPVIHPTTGGTITKYNKLKDDPELKEIWTTAFGKEFGTLSQRDDKTSAKGTNSLFVMDPADIRNISKNRVIAYGRIVPDYREQKEDPNRVRIPVGGNLIN